MKDDIGLMSGKYCLMAGDGIQFVKTTQMLLILCLCLLALTSPLEHKFVILFDNLTDILLTLLFPFAQVKFFGDSWHWLVGMALLASRTCAPMSQSCV